MFSKSDYYYFFFLLRLSLVTVKSFIRVRTCGVFTPHVQHVERKIVSRLYETSQQRFGLHGPVVDSYKTESRRTFNLRICPNRYFGARVSSVKSLNDQIIYSIQFKKIPKNTFISILQIPKNILQLSDNFFVCFFPLSKSNEFNPCSDIDCIDNDTTLFKRLFESEFSKCIHNT